MAAKGNSILFIQLQALVLLVYSRSRSTEMVRQVILEWALFALATGLSSLSAQTTRAGRGLEERSGDRLFKHPVKSEIEVEYLTPGDGLDNLIDSPSASLHHHSAPGSAAQPNGSASDEPARPSRSPCVICIQMLPKCHCAHPEDCSYMPQTCEYCAHYVCTNAAHPRPRPRPTQPTQTSTMSATSTIDESPPSVTGYCIQCWPETPQCHCSPNQRCVIKPGNCHECARAECHGEYTDMEGISMDEGVSYDDGQEIEYEEDLESTSLPWTQ